MKNIKQYAESVIKKWCIMSKMDWLKKETYENVIGTFNLQNLINQLAVKYNTNIIITKIKANIQTYKDKYTVEV